MTGRTFRVGTRIVTGVGSVATLADEIAAFGPERVVVVADRGLSTTGTLDLVFDAAEQLRAAPTILVDPDPSLDDAERLAAEALEYNAGAVVAVGGGSALCAAKAVAIRLTNPGPLLCYEGTGRVPRLPAPTIAIPTTAGSGSEVSNALVLHQRGRTREIVIRGPGCEPTVALLDGNLVVGLPDKPLLYAALDALSHAMEALWTRGRTFFTDSLAEFAVETILEDLPRALKKRDPEVLQRLLEASCAANLACGNTGLGLIHALDCAPSVHLQHGYQNGALLLHVGMFNRAVMNARHLPYLDAVEALFTEIGFAGRFQPGDLDRDHGAAMVAASEGHPFRANNALAATDEDLIGILTAAGVPSDLGIRRS
ncbi:iron-containing alcohol dehydrogenase family protein [Amycolatopsis sp. GM8]|uniref:iron-containing alcohol dehydrogenase family protein n=1 Tax=Amycolatopsis sp. GM8 TaxID=2896530 RepID=UPI001F3F629C|nr:iron-containing alcohol dehydrogenase [Amycolatopsis sp. GM8]